MKSTRKRKLGSRRSISVHAHLSPREYLLAAGMAWLLRKSVATLMSDLLSAELADYEARHPGVLRAAAKEALESRQVDNPPSQE